MAQSPAQADQQWFDTYLANQDQALIPDWMKPGSESYVSNWRNHAHNGYPGGGCPGIPLRDEVYVSMNGGLFHTSNGVMLAGWLERGAQIIAPPA